MRRRREEEREGEGKGGGRGGGQNPKTDAMHPYEFLLNRLHERDIFQSQIGGGVTRGDPGLLNPRAITSST